MPVLMQNYLELFEMRRIVLYPLSFISPFALYAALTFVDHLEELGEGLQWNNLFKDIYSSRINVGVLCALMLLYTLGYLIIQFIVDRIISNGCCFMCNVEFWFCCSIRRDREYTVYDDFDVNPNILMENVPETEDIKIKIRNLRKTFGKTVAIENLDLDIYQGDITVVLGRNGAGKTTLMSMLTGTLHSSFGTAIVDGYDMRFRRQDIQQDIGICPQKDVLFDNLTIKEHIFFYSRLRRQSLDFAESEVHKYTTALELEETMDISSKYLPVGMRRKLSSAIAFCGGSRLVFLDEPSVGLDPKSVQSLWSLIHLEKSTRTIVLFTHSMVEAEFLADRIAILEKGKLRCYGSSFFLKDHYGRGYDLVIKLIWM